MTTTVGNENMQRLQDALAGWRYDSPKAELKRQRARTAARECKAKYKQTTTEAFIEDVEWLLDSGCGLNEIRTRLGYRTTDALAKRLERHGRGDLARRVRPHTLNQMMARP